MTPRTPTASGLERWDWALLSWCWWKPELLALFVDEESDIVPLQVLEVARAIEQDACVVLPVARGGDSGKAGGGIIAFVLYAEGSRCSLRMRLFLAADVVQWRHVHAVFCCF